jgi:hypothetical protein
VIAGHAPTQEPEFDSFRGEVPEARLDKRRKSGETEPIEIIRAFLTEQLASGEVLKFRIYSDPVRAVFARKRAVVLRVVYVVQGPKETRTRDQLFLVQEGEVRQWIDFEAWAALMRRKLAVLAAQQRAAEQAIAAQLAQQQVAQQNLAGRLSQRPRNC